jgi:6-phosphogluconate dehydrogenase
VKLGFIGLGRMGKNMVLNLLEKKNKVVVYNRSQYKVREVVRKGAIGSKTIKEMISKLGNGQKVVWLMIPSGKVTDLILEECLEYLKRGDIIIDGGNSFFKDSLKRHEKVRRAGMKFLDCGVSGGIEGARHGACMMIGGDRKTFKKVEKLFKNMCVKNGYGYMGNAGAGHFVKGIHNGVEYGMMGAIAEGLQAIENQKKKFGTDLGEVIKVYGHGSIVESKLISWLEKSWKEDRGLKKISGVVPKGETEEEMKKLEKIGRMKILKSARKMRIRTRRKPNLDGQIIAAMRNQFGGHKVLENKKFSSPKTSKKHKEVQGNLSKSGSKR